MADTVKSGMTRGMGGWNEAMGVELLPGRFLDFLDPWGNRVELTTYTNIQFTKADHVLQGMGLGHLKKTDEALEELRAKGMAPG